MLLNASAPAFRAPCRSSRAVRRVFVCAGVSLWAVCGASGCGLHDDTDLAGHSAPPASSSIASAGAQRKQRSGASSGLAQSAWTRALLNWMQGASPAVPGAASQPSSGTLRARTAHTVVYVDVAVLARRHPAWRLAEALKAGGNAQAAAGASDEAFGADGQPPLPALPDTGPSMPRLDDSFDFATTTDVARTRTGLWSDWGVAASRATKGFPRSNAAAAGNASAANVALADSTHHEEAAGVAALNSRAGRRQNAALRQFLSVTAVRQNAARDAVEADLRDALLENAATSRRAVLSALTPALPDDVTQLEMTNLRLRLENPRLSITERERARLRLSILETQWRGVLRAQEETARRSETAQRNEAQPRRLSQKDEAKIAALMSHWRDNDATQRAAVDDTLQTRWQQDFGGGQAISSLTMPGFAFSPPFASPPELMPQELMPPASQSAPFFSIAAGHRAGRNRASAKGHAAASWKSGASKPDKTFVGRSASTADLWLADASGQPLRSRLDAVRAPALEQPVTRADPTGRTTQIRALRARALREARLWAAVAARRGGWQWRESTLQQRDAKRAAQTVIGTRATLRILNLS